MTLEEFISSIHLSTPPQSLSLPLLALWYDAQGLWEKGHDTIQNESDTMSALVHAYLHRKEGDLWNARYWYSRAKRKPFQGALNDEWETIVKELLEHRKAA